MKWILSLFLLTPVLCFAETYSKVVEAAPTVDTAAYADGDIIGAELSLTAAARSNVNTGTITSVELIDKDKETVNIDIVFFDTDPGAMGNDNAAFDPTDTDLLNIVCVVSLTTHADFNDNGISIARDVNCPFDLGAGNTTLYAAIVARAAVTYTAGTDLLLRVGITQD